MNEKAITLEESFCAMIKYFFSSDDKQQMLWGKIILTWKSSFLFEGKKTIQEEKHKQLQICACMQSVCLCC